MTRPDFSGEYVLNRHASMLSATIAGVVESGRMRVEHREPNFRAQLTVVMAGNPFHAAFELTTDGREVASAEHGRSSTSSLRWDGDALAFAHRGEGTMTFRYELLDDGARLRATEQVRGTDHDQDNTWVFDRQ